MGFEAKLKYLMQIHGLTQSDLGSALGTTHKSVSNWLRGAKPRQSKMKALATYFKVDVASLIDDNLDLSGNAIDSATSEDPPLSKEKAEAIAARLGVDISDLLEEKSVEEGSGQYPASESDSYLSKLSRSDLDLLRALRITEISSSKLYSEAKRLSKEGEGLLVVSDRLKAMAEILKSSRKLVRNG